MGNNIGTCALCKKTNTILEKSHIIPKFIFRRIVKKSATGFMRNPFNPDERIQDGDKQYLLCGECEDLFNVSETLFANKIFHGYKGGKLKEFQYEKWLNFFITSVNWRTLYLDIQGFKNDNSITKENLKVLMEDEEILRDYLLGKRNDISDMENHIVFFDDVKLADKQTSMSEPHSFFRHSSFGYTYISHDYNGYYVITNLSGILICTILKKSKIERWENTIVKIDKGNFRIENQKVKSPVMDDIFEYMKESQEAKKNISKEEIDKVINIIKRDPEKFMNTEIYKNHLLDEKLKEK
ncbi:conserved hypothetical protein [Clostridium botulinum B str. Eklund 17B (NRP)]|uniref:HNH endonuclease n=1 Tax=Clostridium botulinum (strain Eklund 17B / Type B) TaxID=935198 RepID=B2TMX8_CLOBB|nr:conserved hypothetical protein [Clostridium botulinum B str. Eklund 17B (NRP)]MBY6977114.1 hypothetical protein [Clostridium botulinum]MBY6999272.1 hypothetical protein [Clostridium botulinum]MCR1272646.1 hypothetical protein [Clostridium botulinum]